MLTITNEDNMELMARYPDKHFELAIVDPPYGIGATSGTNDSMRKKIKSGKIKGGNWDSVIPPIEYFMELKRVSKNQIIWGGNYFPLPPSKCFLIWDKGESMYGRDFAECEMAWASFDRCARMYKLFPNQSDRIHPTQKPVGLYKWILDRFATKGDKILDTHLGSGSIAIACHDYGFDLTACELDKDYFEKAMERINNHTKQIKLF